MPPDQLYLRAAGPAGTDRCKIQVSISQQADRSGAGPIPANDVKRLARMLRHGKRRGRYGIRKVWYPRRRDEHDIARCTRERLMHLHRLQKGVRGQTTTAISDPAQPCPDDGVDRQCVAAMPDRLRVSDFTYV